ncbi:NAD(P)-binding protein [Lentinus brumalis]|uniref:NAD(P)-binding protein n=1 Tax=Lentinus brumalis TaxID=2498619 RepID=A0A371D498_9APHY|nr:NAD(P)-binding protein [Polyporus brumalis]
MSSQQYPENIRVWFITGSSQGLGRALLEEVLEAGERAVATARRPEALSDLSQRYPASQLLVVALDVTHEEQIVNAFAETKEHFGRLDVVVNNAGYGIQSEIEGTPEHEARRMVETLFWGPVHVTKEAIKFLRDVNPPGHGGRVLNISSAGGYIGNATRAYYNAGKFALEGFTESFTKEMLPEWNIKGVIIEPGGFRTEWGGSSMLHLPVHPAYDKPHAPAVRFREMTKGAVFIGDPRKAARAMMQVASMADPPLRVQLGTDALMLVRNKARMTLRDNERYEELAHSTNADGVDRDKVMEKLAEASR